jgi:hypothetical protein
MSGWSKVAQKRFGGNECKAIQTEFTTKARRHKGEIACRKIARRGENRKLEIRNSKLEGNPKHE